MDTRPESAYEATPITSLYGIDNQSKKEIAIHNKKEQTATFRPTAQAPRWKKLFAPLARVYHKTLIPSTHQYSARIYEQTDDDILAALDPSKRTTQAERESYFRRFGLLPPSERVVKRYPNIVNSKDITGSTTGLAMIAVSGSPSDVSTT